ncbi:DBP-2 [Buzura suppressaria nucleopolyhedrovirus]|uniref:DBP-2 n=1 Tax=Buzura suppressaria nuclear polyhedrosis virus TaxID=74320 RepID=W5VKB5_NPVBS|nr:DBP-2 [Buzura suppressaria nucleopolyhedrovirus]AHH82615.1 DBP-2 [Buzura suppressaria nucleopolyhedrovirus]
MSKRTFSESSLVDDEQQASPSAASSSENLQLDLCKASAYTSTSLAKAVMIVDDHDDKMLVFSKRDSCFGFEDELMYNMKAGNTTVIYCLTPNNHLNDYFGSLKNRLNLNKHLSTFYPDINANVGIEKASPPRTVNQIGLCVAGGLMQYYFFDSITVQMCYGKHGFFLKMTWTDMPIHNHIISKFLCKYNQWDVDMLKMQDHVLINVPNEGQNLYKLFFDVCDTDNHDVFQHGIKACRQQLVCRAHTYERFREMFNMDVISMPQKDMSPKISTSIKMYMFALLEGYKTGKEQNFDTVEKKTKTEKTYSLAVSPICFFYIKK